MHKFCIKNPAFMYDYMYPRKKFLTVYSKQWNAQFGSLQPFHVWPPPAHSRLDPLSPPFIHLKENTIPHFPGSLIMELQEGALGLLLILSTCAPCCSLKTMIYWQNVFLSLHGLEKHWGININCYFPRAYLFLPRSALASPNPCLQALGKLFLFIMSQVETKHKCNWDSAR